MKSTHLNLLQVAVDRGWLPADLAEETLLRLAPPPPSIAELQEMLDREVPSK